MEDLEEQEGVKALEIIDLDKFMEIMDVFAEYVPELATADEESVTVDFLHEHEAMSKWLQTCGLAAQAEAQAYLQAAREEEEREQKNREKETMEDAAEEKRGKDQKENGDAAKKRKTEHPSRNMKKGITEAGYNLRPYHLRNRYRSSSWRGLRPWRASNWVFHLYLLVPCPA